MARMPVDGIPRRPTNDRRHGSSMSSRKEKRRQQQAQNGGYPYYGQQPYGQPQGGNGYRDGYAGTQGGKSRKANSKKGGKRYKPETRGRKALKIFGITIGVILMVATSLVAVGVALMGNQMSDTNQKLAGNGVQVDVAKAPDTLPDDFYMLLLGVDSDADREASGAFGGTYRSDTIMLAHVDTKEGKMALMSFHRDLKTQIAGRKGYDKLNAAYAYGGVDMMKNTISNLTGIEDIPYYAIINMDGLAGLVDAVGGIEVNVPYTFRDSYLNGEGLDAGVQTVNGHQALIFARSRHAYDNVGSGDGDSYRAKNQREVIRALGKKASQSNYLQLLSIANTVSKNVATNMSVEQMAELASKMGKTDVMDNMISMITPTTSLYENKIWYESLDTAKWNLTLEAFQKYEQVTTNDTGKIESIVTTDADGNVTGSDDGNGAKSDSNDLNPDGYSSGEK